MKKAYLIVSMILLVIAVLCIGATVREVIRGDYGMWTGDFWGAVAFHFVIAAVGCLLLVKAQPKKQQA